MSKLATLIDRLTLASAAIAAAGERGLGRFIFRESDRAWAEGHTWGDELEAHGELADGISVDAGQRVLSLLAAIVGELEDDLDSPGVGLLRARMEVILEQPAWNIHQLSEVEAAAVDWRRYCNFPHSRPTIAATYRPIGGELLGALADAAVMLGDDDQERPAALGDAARGRRVLRLDPEAAYAPGRIAELVGCTPDFARTRLKRWRSKNIMSEGKAWIEVNGGSEDATAFMYRGLAVYSAFVDMVIPDPPGAP